jgi:polysaccharide biosynthesis transport protein
MSIQEYMRLARRHLLLLVTVPLLLAALGYFVANSQAKSYRSTAQVLLRPNDPNERVGTGGTGTEILNADRIVQAQANIARGPDVRREAAAKLGIISDVDLKKVLTVTPSTNSNILNISADDATPERAAEIANAVANAFIANRRAFAVAGLGSAIEDLDRLIREVQTKIGSLAALQASDPARTAQLDTAQAQFQSLSDKRLQLSIDRDLKRGEAELINGASPNFVPVRPTPLRNAILGGLVGLGLVGAIVLLRDRLDTRLRSREDAEQISSLSTLAEIPFDRVSDRGNLRVAAEDDPDGLVAEATRSLRVSLRFLGLERPLKVILVTSALPGDGKSTVSINLAHSYAEAGSKTLLVSADLRRPHVERIASVNAETGLVELLDEMAAAKEQNRVESSRTSRLRSDRTLVGAAAILNCCSEEAPNMWLLPAGRRIANPVEILGSAVAKEFFARAAEDFDVVVVDSPPVLAVADAVVLSQFVDGVLLVTSLQQTQREALGRAVEILGNGRANVLGLVLNRVRSEGSYGYGGYGAYSYAKHRPARPTGIAGLASRLGGRGRSSSRRAA